MIPEIFSGFVNFIDNHRYDIPALRQYYEKLHKE